MLGLAEWNAQKKVTSTSARALIYAQAMRVANECHELAIECAKEAGLSDDEDPVETITRSMQRWKWEVRQRLENSTGIQMDDNPYVIDPMKGTNAAAQCVIEQWKNDGTLAGIKRSLRKTRKIEQRPGAPKTHSAPVLALAAKAPEKLWVGLAMAPTWTWRHAMGTRTTWGRPVWEWPARMAEAIEARQNGQQREKINERTMRTMWASTKTWRWKNTSPPIRAVLTLARIGKRIENDREWAAALIAERAYGCPEQENPSAQDILKIAQDEPRATENWIKENAIWTIKTAAGISSGKAGTIISAIDEAWKTEPMLAQGGEETITRIGQNHSISVWIVPHTNICRVIVGCKIGAGVGPVDNMSELADQWTHAASNQRAFKIDIGYKYRSILGHVTRPRKERAATQDATRRAIEQGLEYTRDKKRQRKASSIVGVETP